ncbi:phage head-tail adapter protein [uncultured Ruminococcus sp.]|uniref:phage head-tail adapter protein n=1 Tax=uncultured Ruminococcus sp. TaxID=165186 RepID=UPI002606B44D|nr:phage head-tail adapter protein [uncultured Ruminococcus sp.]
MNKAWSELNKAMQLQIKKNDTFNDGIRTLFLLRNELMDTLTSVRTTADRADFNAMPFVNANGYHSKTIAYSIWHIFRIEDIVAHTLINSDEQVFFKENYQKRIGSPIITTGNELVKSEIAEFSELLGINELYSYISEVKASTESIIRSLTFSDMKSSVPEARKELLRSLNVVSSDESASWLIDYWCGKDIRGLIQMPFSRHWIMHIEASLRILNKLR